MNAEAEGIGPPPRIRPGWVWGILIFFAVSLAWSLVAWVQVFRGTYPVPQPEQQALLQSQTPISLTIGFTLAALKLLAAVWLWRLRKRAFELFVAGFVLAWLYTAWHFASGSPLSQLLTQSPLMVAISIFGALFGVGIQVAICLYVWRLRQRGVLE